MASNQGELELMMNNNEENKFVTEVLQEEGEGKAKRRSKQLKSEDFGEK